MRGRPRLFWELNGGRPRFLPVPRTGAVDCCSMPTFSGCSVSGVGFGAVSDFLGRPTGRFPVIPLVDGIKAGAERRGRLGTVWSWGWLLKFRSCGGYCGLFSIGNFGAGAVCVSAVGNSWGFSNPILVD